MALVKYNNNSISTISSAGQLASGSLVPISEQTASGSASIEFTTGIDNTYPIYKFEFINIHPSANNRDLRFNLSTDGGSTYAVTKTTAYFLTSHTEDDTFTELQYKPNDDLAQSTSDQPICRGIGGNSDESGSGFLYLFNPSSTTFVKHFLSNTQAYGQGGYTVQQFVGGYGNTTSAINGVRFNLNGGLIDSGTIKLYGIKDS
jgi:hypothetical protein